MFSLSAYISMTLAFGVLNSICTVKDTQVLAVNEPLVTHIVTSTTGKPNRYVEKKAKTKNNNDDDDDDEEKEREKQLTIIIEKMSKLKMTTLKKQEEE